MSVHKQNIEQLTIYLDAECNFDSAADFLAGWRRTKLRIHHFFYYDVKWRRNMSLIETQSKNASDIALAIREELYVNVEVIRKVLDATQWVLFFFSIIVVIM